MKNSFGRRVRNLKEKYFLTSLLIGGLTGAVIMVLLAPQSGRQARANLYQRSILMGDREQMNHVSSTTKAPGVPVKGTPARRRPAFLKMGNRGSKIRYSSLMPKTEDQLLIEDLLANDSPGG